MFETILLIILILLVILFGIATLVLLFKQANAQVDDGNSQAVEVLQKQLESLNTTFRHEAAQTRKEADEAARQGRTELAQTLKQTSDSMNKQLGQNAELQGKQFDSFSQRLSHVSDANEKRLETMRQTIETKLKQLQEDNNRKLEEMRKTVDEKLQGTLEKRLGESFKQVSERLEQVHKGLGEMQNLATGVGDLKRIMTNIKTRGTWGEMQLDRLLEQIFTPNQYDKNVATVPNSNVRVEFAIRLPGRDLDDDKIVYLPIDAKFPTEDYDRLAQATEVADVEAIQASQKALETRIKLAATDISEKYLAPPHTTDFGIMFLPTEGLFAEVVRNTGLVDHVRQTNRVIIAGPTTITALLNSLQMGFRTLAIEKRSSEVWKVLAEVKVEFDKFGGVLEKVEKQLNTAAKSIQSTQVRTRAMKRKLRDVESLPENQEAAGLLDFVDDADAEISEQ